MIDIKKEYRTRDGKKVKIYYTEGGGEFPVHGAIQTDSGWHPKSWNKNGSLWCDSCFDKDDLVEDKPRIYRDVWVNVYCNSSGTYHTTRETADAVADAGRVACIKLTIDCKEGEGL